MKITYHLSWPSDWATYLLGPFPCLAPCTKKNRTKKSWVSVHLGRCKKKKTALPILQTHGFWVDESDVSELPASTPRPLRFIAGQWQLINSSAFLRDQFLAFHIPCVSGWMVLFPSSMDLGGNGGNGSVKKVLAANKWQNYIQKVAVICPLNFVNFVINFGNY